MKKQKILCVIVSFAFFVCIKADMIVTDIVMILPGLSIYGSGCIIY